jgi:hypothetical protein
MQLENGKENIAIILKELTEQMETESTLNEMSIEHLGIII